MNLKEIIIGPERLPIYTHSQVTTLVILRVFIGWHFLYEGVAKIFNPYWTSAGYLSESKWLFSDLFLSLAANPVILKIVDVMNMWGLVAIGVFGFFFLAAQNANRPIASVRQGANGG